MVFGEFKCIIISLSKSKSFNSISETIISGGKDDSVFKHSLLIIDL